MPIKFANKRYLAIDDDKDQREALKSMVRLCGGSEVDSAKNGSEAISLMRENSYDVILCDYHLSEGKDGQQVLEQARHENLITPTSIFMLITAEASSEMVMGALEYQPDGYIIKPLNTAILKSRIEKALNVKERLRPIYKHINEGNLTKAFDLMDSAIENNRQYLTPCMQIKSDYFLEHEQYREAKDLFVELLKEKNDLWIKFGLGQAYYGLKRYKDALTVFGEIIEETPTHLQAYDASADCHVELDEKQAAIEILRKALDISPHAIKRQVRLGLLAEDTGNSKLAESCFREAVKRGKHSVYKSAENYISLARNIVSNFSKNKNDNIGPGNEAIAFLHEARSDYKNNKVVGVEVLVLESITQKSLGKVKEAEKCLNIALETLEPHMKIPIRAQMDMLKACQNLGKTDEIETLAEMFIEHGGDDPELVEKINATLDSCSLNYKGMSLYYDEKYDEAIEVFDRAIEEFPHNISIHLNAAQAVMMIMEKNGRDPAMCERFERYFNEISDITSKDDGYDRYKELKRRYARQFKEN